jgi:sugar/nucleoside kinase (ribokinase family)
MALRRREERVARAYDYVTVGHVTVDVIADDGSRRPGGGAFYSALQAARLGQRTLIVTRGAPAELDELLEPYREELEIRVEPAERTTTLVTRGAGARRSQCVLAWAGPIADVPALDTATLDSSTQTNAEAPALDTAILHLAPVARETPTRWRGRADFVGVTPQGLVRRWERSSGEIVVVPLDLGLLPERYDAVVFGASERASCAQLIARIPDSGATIAVTGGAEPVTVHWPGNRASLKALSVAPPVDDLGAGDVFAAAFFIALRDGCSPAQAAQFGNAAAAVRIAGAGPDAVGTRAAIEVLIPSLPPRA